SPKHCQQSSRTGVRLEGWKASAFQPCARLLLHWRSPMEVHLIDGTYELFRHFYAMPPAKDEDGREVAAVRGVVNSVLGMITAGATHVGVATDHVIESFRNRMWRGYKTGAGIDPALYSQFTLLEEA